MISLHPSSADYPSLVPPHWRSALAATVILVTVVVVGRDATAGDVIAVTSRRERYR
jgi:hypothetical protein